MNNSLFIDDNLDFFIDCQIYPPKMWPSFWNLSAAREYQKNGHDMHALITYLNLRKELGTNCFDYNIKRLVKNYTFGYLLRKLQIENVYILNLSHDIIKKEIISIELASQDVKFDIIAGVKGDSNSLSISLCQNFSENIIYFKDRFQHICNKEWNRIESTITPGIFGYLLSQKKIFNDALIKKYKKICIFDDDMMFVDFVNAYIQRLCKSNIFETKWKVLMLGASEYSENVLLENKDLGSTYYTPIPGKTCGSFAVCYDLSIYDEILSLLQLMPGPFDNLVLGDIFKNFSESSFVVYPNLCAADVSTSGIREKRNMIKHARKMHWNISEKRYNAYINKYFKKS